MAYTAMQKLKIDLYHEIHGSGPPLLLLSGLAADTLSWVLQVGPLATRHSLLVCDNRGAGRSPTPPGPYTIAAMAQDVVRLLDRLQLPRVHVVGHSMGGAIAQQLALDFPERVDRLVLACSFSQLVGRSLAVTEGWSMTWARGPSPAEFARVLLPWVYSPHFFEQAGNLEAAVLAIQHHPCPITPGGLQAQVEALKAFDSRARLSHIRADCLVLAAELDLLVPLHVSQHLAEAIPGARLKMLPGAHSCMVEAADLFNRSVLEFLAGPAD